jgi:hypothetical protein
MVFTYLCNCNGIMHWMFGVSFINVHALLPIAAAGLLQLGLPVLLAPEPLPLSSPF